MTHKIDPVDFQKTMDDLQAMIDYGAHMLYPEELQMLKNAKHYLDIMASKNWEIDDGN